jgi:CRISPR-associated protein Csm3
MAVTRYTFRGALELAGALHIGSGGGGRIGETENWTDASVIRDSRGRPYIPGSSLRGTLRAAILQIAPALFERVNLDLREDEQFFQDLKNNMEKQVQGQRLAAGGSGFDDEAARQNWLAGNLSPTERLFGTVLWASPLHIRDLHLLSGRADAGEVRHGVGIDRDTGAAKEQIKYDFEVLPAGARFDFWMRCDVPDSPREYLELWPRLLAIGLRLLEQGELTLGGRAARGVGQVRLRNLEAYRLDAGDRSALLGALLADEDSPARLGSSQGADWARRVLQEVS